MEISLNILHIPTRCSILVFPINSRRNHRDVIVLRKNIPFFLSCTVTLINFFSAVANKFDFSTFQSLLFFSTRKMNIYLNVGTHSKSKIMFFKEDNAVLLKLVLHLKQHAKQYNFYILYFAMFYVTLYDLANNTNCYQ